MRYDYDYVTRKGDGYNGNQLFNSVKPSTYEINYREMRRVSRWRRRVIVMCVGFAAAYLLLYFGVFDWVVK